MVLHPSDMELVIGSHVECGEFEPNARGGWFVEQVQVSVSCYCVHPLAILSAFFFLTKFNNIISYVFK